MRGCGDLGGGVGKCEEKHVEVNVGEVGDDEFEEGEIIEATEEHADPKVSIPTPELPTLSEMEKHREDHIPYASWCDHCVEGRGRERAHMSINQGSRVVTTLSFDYLFVNEKGLFTRE